MNPPVNPPVAPGPAPRAAVGPDRAGRELLAGRAVVLPNPAPLTHVVAATTAPAVNGAKGRPADQPVALWAHHADTLDALAGLWDLAPAHHAPVRHLLAGEHLTVLLPVRPGAVRPSWSDPAVKDGWMLLFGAYWEPLRPLLDAHPLLYVSSANRTGLPPVADAAGALAMFPPTVSVLRPPDRGGDGPAPTARQATTTVRVLPGGELRLHRPGAQDRAYGPADAYLRDLYARTFGR
ncbi:hypothetical protein ACGFXC_34785 [Streptomyces sp. NPDC048507]|uniref:hypothetical protein n=1 Tax=Streptomyces sp. NPDC048507 TaxID=3365560 RepID=UPI00371A0320